MKRFIQLSLLLVCISMPLLSAAKKGVIIVVEFKNQYTGERIIDATINSPFFNEEQFKTNVFGLVQLPKLALDSITLLIEHPDYKPQVYTVQDLPKRGKHFITIYLDYNKTRMNKIYAEQRKTDSIHLANGTLQQTAIENCQSDSISYTGTARFPGGTPSMNHFLIEHVRYPYEAVRNNEQGEVIVKFSISAKGVVTNPTIQQSVSPLIDEEVLRLIKLMPDWTPAYCNGEPVESTITLPVNFSLS